MVYAVLVALLTLAICVLFFAELHKSEKSWQQRQESIALKQEYEWQSRQLQITRDLMEISQPLLLDHQLIDLIARTYQEQQDKFSAGLNNAQRQHDQLFEKLKPHWQKLHEQGLSELNLHFYPVLLTVNMDKPTLLTDSIDQSRPEIIDAFKTAKVASSFSVSRQGAAIRLIVPIKEGSLLVAVIELSVQLEQNSSAAALLHKELADVLLWDESRKQMHPSLVGDWRLESTFDPIATWWKQGLVIAEKSRQIIKTSNSIFLMSWINHSTRRLALLVWTDISSDYAEYQQDRRHIYWKWLGVFALFQSTLFFGFFVISKKYQQDLAIHKQQLNDEHKLAEQSTARLTLALRSSDSGFWEWSIVKNKIHFSPEWRQLLKLPPGDDEMDMTDWVSVVDPNHRRSHHNDMMNHLKGVTPMFENEYRVKTGEGDYRWILSRGKVVERNASGRATLIIGVYTDITDRKSTELISIRQQAALQTLNEITSLPINDVDEQLRRALILAAKYLGVTRAGISEVTKNNYQYRIFVDVQEKISVPLTGLDNSYCELVLLHKALIAEDNIPGSDYVNNPGLENIGHESYIGTPIIISGVIQGTLFFSAPKSRERDYDQLDKDFVQLLARWASAVIDRSHRDEEKRIIIERFKKLSEHLPGFLYQYQLCPDGTSFYPYASPGIYNIYGVTAEEVSQSEEKMLEVIHPDELTWIAETISYSASNLTPWVATVRVNNPNRGLVWTHVQSIPEKLDDGSVLWHGYVSDITSLKNTEIKLERANAMHQAILDAASVAMITTDINGIIKTFNRGAEMMLGYSPEDIIDKKTLETFHDSDEIITRSKVLSEYFGTHIKPGFDVFIAKVKGGEDDENEWSYIRRSGAPLTVLLTVSALRDKFGDITGYLSIARDISELKRIDKMKNEFVSTVSHELRTPLTSISGALGIVTNGLMGSLPEQAANMIKIAHNNSLRLIHLVNDLLDMEKLLAGKMQFDMKPHSILELIKRSVEANASYAEKFNVEFQIDERADDGVVVVDGDRIQQVLANFLSNAVKFSPEKSIIEIKSEIISDRVRVKVVDKGAGIPEEFRSRIFKKFSQADSSDTRQKGGTGLGLAICKEMIERMAGKIGFESILGQGSCFYFELICHSEKSEDQIRERHKFQPTKILIVEDDKNFAEYLKSTFENHEFVVDLAESGNRALEFLSLRDFDLISLDLLLPDMHGVEILKQIRSHESGSATATPVPVVIITSDPEDGKKRVPESLGNSKGTYWIQKPLIEGEPLMTVDYALLQAKKYQEE